MADNQQGTESNSEAGNNASETKDATTGPAHVATGSIENATGEDSSAAEAKSESPGTKADGETGPDERQEEPDFHITGKVVIPPSLDEEALNKPLVDEVSEDVAQEVGEFFEQSAEQNETILEESHEPFISFENVFKTFGDFKVLEDVSFFVRPGETLCILGRSGVGKSVSLQMLMGFLKPDSGSVRVANEDISGFTEDQMRPVRRKVTMVFQNGALFDSVSVGENVAFPLREKGELDEEQIRQVVKGLLEMVGVAGMDNLLPSDLSTGMKRSIAIARALAAQPEAVLYDEPTTMVDPLMAHLLGDLIERLKRQLHLTSIVVTHDMRFARKLADRVLFLHEGKGRFFGTIDELEKCDDEVLRDFMAMDELVLPQ